MAIDSLSYCFPEICCEGSGGYKGNSKQSCTERYNVSAEGNGRLGRCTGGMVLNLHAATEGVIADGLYRAIGGNRGGSDCTRRSFEGRYPAVFGDNLRRNFYQVLHNGTGTRLRGVVGRNVGHPDTEEYQEQSEYDCSSTYRKVSSCTALWLYHRGQLTTCYQRAQYFDGCLKRN